MEPRLYLHFPIYVSFSATLLELVFPISLSHTSPCDLEVCSMMLTYEFDLDKVKLNHNAKYLGKRSFFRKLYTHRHEHIADRPLYTATKLINNNCGLQC